LLLADLCARLPHGVICKDTNINVTGTLSQIGLHYDMCVLDKDNGDSESCYILNCKPYLFPLSSMTTFQENEFHFLFPSLVVNRDEYGFVDIISKSTKDKWEDTYNYQTYLNDWKKAIQWLLKNHFDINKLIPKNLAINATVLNIY
jgi:hypothetical protein